MVSNPTETAAGAGLEGSREGAKAQSGAPEAIAMPADTLFDRARSAALWASGVSWLAPMLGTMTVMHKLRPDAALQPLNRLYCAGQMRVMGIRWRAEVDPAVDPDQPYIFVQNHTNHLDHVAMYNATPHFKQGIELAKHFDYPFYGWFMKARGTIPVKRGGGQAPEVLAHMRREIAKGRSLLAFPEGTRTTTGRVGPFRRGIFFIARELGIPVVPVAVTGMYEVMRKGSLVVRPGDVTVHICAPHSAEGLDDDGIGALTTRVRDVIAGHVDRHWDAKARKATT